jgi:hypothetical protein
MAEQESTNELLRRVLDEQTRQAALLRLILASLERGRGVLPIHVALLVAIAEAIGGRAFTGAQLLAHAQTSPHLRDALEAAGITNAREFGWLARRLESSVVPGIRLQRLGGARDGLRWCVRVSSEETREA